MALSLPRSEDEPVPFFSWVGRYIKRWTHVESSLFSICASLLQVDNKIAAVVFFRTPTVKSRMDLINDLMGTRFNDRSGIRRRWKALLKRLRDEAEFRNFVAHQPTAMSYAIYVDLRKTYPASIDPPADDALIISQSQAEGTYKKHKIKEVNTADLRAHYAVVFALADDIRVFRNDLDAAITTAAVSS